MSSDVDARHMQRALELARRGEGHVEPNPMVGCVIADGERVLGEGWHDKFGGPHAEVAAIEAAVEVPAGATFYVTLEPCCHQGKTPPCAPAIVKCAPARVVVGALDPSPAVNGQGVAELRAAGIEVEVGVLPKESDHLIAPFRKRVTQGLPWVIAKWAMTLDGKIATRAGDSRWISSSASRNTAHRLRGRVDAVLVGSGTVRADDPLLTARPAGPRMALRIVADSQAQLPLSCRLVETAAEYPLAVAVADDAPDDRVAAFEERGVQVIRCQGHSHGDRLHFLLMELAVRGVTNLLVEGGGRLLGLLFDERAIDEVHVFIAPKIVGGATAVPAIAGEGLDTISAALAVTNPHLEMIGDDVYLSGRVQYD